VQPDRDVDAGTEIHRGVILDCAAGEGGAGAVADSDTGRAGARVDVVGEGAVVDVTRDQGLALVHSFSLT